MQTSPQTYVLVFQYPNYLLQVGKEKIGEFNESGVALHFSVRAIQVQLSWWILISKTCRWITDVNWITQRATLCTSNSQLAFLNVPGIISNYASTDSIRSAPRKLKNERNWIFEELLNSFEADASLLD